MIESVSILTELVLGRPSFPNLNTLPAKIALYLFVVRGGTMVIDE
jgi:hypothetical protein